MAAARDPYLPHLSRSPPHPSRLPPSRLICPSCSSSGQARLADRTLSVTPVLVPLQRAAPYGAKVSFKPLPSPQERFQAELQSATCLMPRWRSNGEQAELLLQLAGPGLPYQLRFHSLDCDCDCDWAVARHLAFQWKAVDRTRSTWEGSTSYKVGSRHVQASALQRRRYESTGYEFLPCTLGSLPPSSGEGREPGLQKVIGNAPSSSSFMLQVGAYVIRADAPQSRIAGRGAGSRFLSQRHQHHHQHHHHHPLPFQRRNTAVTLPFIPQSQPWPSQAQQPRLTFAVHGERPEERVDPCWQQGPAPLNLQHTTSRPCTDHEYPRRSLAQMGLQREA
ncbi:hypothetical protein CCMA1212_004594 [Trichoderma ghanense]|uniref:Uncharacterized protein n=1 Tax=Trichoderma ghanense TaxID=65468 RepID=A0ABY2H5Z8_9HYPO